MAHFEGLSKFELKFIAAVLGLVFVLVGGDIVYDIRVGGSGLHLGLEVVMAMGSMLGLFILLKSSFATKTVLRQVQQDLEKSRVEARKWKDESQKYIDGLSQAIDAQFARWGLSVSEKEVALLLLKGLSLKKLQRFDKPLKKPHVCNPLLYIKKQVWQGVQNWLPFF